MSQNADPTHPVRMQLDAYNARDIDAFMMWWAEDCRYYAFPDTLLAEGRRPSASAISSASASRTSRGASCIASSSTIS